jgi:hypothetical protein
MTTEPGSTKPGILEVDYGREITLKCEATGAKRYTSDLVLLCLFDCFLFGKTVSQENSMAWDKKLTVGQQRSMRNIILVGCGVGKG